MFWAPPMGGLAFILWPFRLWARMTSSFCESGIASVGIARGGRAPLLLLSLRERSVCCRVGFSSLLSRVLSPAEGGGMLRFLRLLPSVGSFCPVFWYRLGPFAACKLLVLLPLLGRLAIDGLGIMRSISARGG